MKADETLDDLGRWRFLRPHQPEAAQRVLACFVILRPESILDALGPFGGFADAFFEPEAGQVPGPDGCGARTGKTEWWAEVPEPSAAHLRGDEAAPAPPPDSAGGSQGPRRSSVASQTRRSSHHQAARPTSDLFGPDNPDDTNCVFGHWWIAPVAEEQQESPDGASCTVVHRMSTGTHRVRMTCPLRADKEPGQSTRSSISSQKPNLRPTHCDAQTASARLTRVSRSTKTRNPRSKA